MLKDLTGAVFCRRQIPPPKFKNLETSAAVFACVLGIVLFLFLVCLLLRNKLGCVYRGWRRHLHRSRHKATPKKIRKVLRHRCKDPRNSREMISCDTSGFS